MQDSNWSSHRTNRVLFPPPRPAVTLPLTRMELALLYVPHPFISDLILNN